MAKSAVGRMFDTFRHTRRQPRIGRSLAVALQGGGSFGAFNWGVLDRLLEEDAVVFDAVSGTSAGAVNAVALAAGLAEGDRAAARRILETVWRRVSRAALPSLPGHPIMSMTVEFSTRFLSPYQLNPLAINPLRDVLESEIDFGRLRSASPVHLIIAATAVGDGRPRYFGTQDLTVDAVLASACVPALHQAVRIDGEWYWDGGFTSNPPLVRLAAQSHATDLLLVQIIPSEEPRLPATSSHILRRVQQIAFNAPLRKELEQLVGLKEVACANGRLLNGDIGRLQRLRLHRIVAEREVDGLESASAFDLDWRFLTKLKERGRSAADKWLQTQGLQA